MTSVDHPRTTTGEQGPAVPIEKLSMVHADPASFAIQRTAAESTGSDDSLHEILHKLLRNRMAVFGIAAVAIIVALAVFVPLLGPATADVGISNRFLPPRIPILESFGIFDGVVNGTDMYAQAGVPKDVYYLFGADNLGRDQWIRIWSGTRVSLLIAAFAFGIDIIVGMNFGLFSGYFSGKVDAVMQSTVEILSGIPQLVIVTLFAFVIGPGFGAIIFGLLITNWLPMSRVSRAQALKRKEEEYVLASRTLGSRHLPILFKDIMPNILGPVLTMSMFSIPAAIFTESYLSFVGLGVQPPTVSLGSLVNTGYKSFLTYPFLVIIPVLVLAILMISFNLVADGLKDATDPKQIRGAGR